MRMIPFSWRTPLVRLNFRAWPDASYFRIRRQPCTVIFLTIVRSLPLYKSTVFRERRAGEGSVIRLPAAGRADCAALVRPMLACAAGRVGGVMAQGRLAGDRHAPRGMAASRGVRLGCLIRT